MHTVHPLNSECFHPCLLLHIVKSPISFQDLCTINGCTYLIFKEACSKYGLFDNDDCYDHTFQDVSMLQSPLLFVNFLPFCWCTAIHQYKSTIFLGEISWQHVFGHPYATSLCINRQNFTVYTCNVQLRHHPTRKAILEMGIRSLNSYSVNSP